MWRLFRFHLKKDFSSYKFKFVKLNSTTTTQLIYSIEIISDKSETFTMNICYDKNTTSEIFSVMYDSLKNQIKDRLFNYKKKQRFLKK